MTERKKLPTREGYAIWASTYDQEQNPLILTEEPLVKRLLATLPAPADVLDVATGTGRWALYLAEHGARVVGIDESPEMLAVARAKARAANLPITWVEGALEDGLPFPPERFDLVVCALALCHVLDLHQAIAVCSRVLRPGGSLLITDFHPQAIHSGWRTMIVGSGDVYTIPNAHHSVPAYLDAIRESGCEVVHVEQVLVRDQPQEAMLTGPDVESFMREYGDWPFCLIVLARRTASNRSIHE